MKIFVVACTVFLTLLNVNKSDGQESLSPNALNIIVILDTSNRVSPERQPGQIERDIKIVEEIVAQFEEVVGGEKGHIAKSPELAYEDSLTVVVPNQPGVSYIPWEIMEKLTIEDPRGHTSLSGIYKNLEEQKNALLDEIPRLYEFVVQDKQTGSDIWDWFQSEAEGYFDEKKRNLIICLSDGYLNFDRSIEEERIEGSYMKVSELRNDPNWKQRIDDGEGLRKVGDFSPYNVKFLMLEIALQKNRSGIPYQKDFDIIKAYWDIWLKSMEIKATGFIQRGRPVRPKIRSLISAESRQG